MALTERGHYSGSVVTERGHRVTTSALTEFGRLIVTTAAVHVLNLSTSTGSTAGLARRVGKIVAASTSSTAMLVRRVSRLFSTSTASTAGLLRRVGMVLATTSASSSTLATARIWAKSLTTSTGSTAALTRRVGLILSASSSSSSTVRRDIARRFAASTDSTVALVRRVEMRLSTSSASEALIALARIYRRTLATSTGSTATLSSLFIGVKLGVLLVSDAARWLVSAVDRAATALTVFVARSANSASLASSDQSVTGLTVRDSALSDVTTTEGV